MNLLLVVGLIAISLGLGLGVLGGLRRASPQDANAQALPAERPTAKTTDDDFVFPASDATTGCENDTDRGFVFPASGRRAAHRRGERSDAYATATRTGGLDKFGVPDEFAYRDHTTEDVPGSDAAPESTMGLNIIEDREGGITEWKQTVNTESTYPTTGAEWGSDFNGDFLFEVEPDAAYDAAIQKTAAASSEGLAFFVEVSDGAVHSATPIDSTESDQYDYGFTYHGPYTNWKALITQDIGPIDGLLSGQFAIEGDMQKILQWSDGLVDLVSSAGRVETIFPDELD